MPRTPRPLNESWQHTLVGASVLPAFLECADAALKSGILPTPGPEQITLVLPYEQITGTLGEVRQNLLPEDAAELQSASLKIASAPTATPAPAPTPGSAFAPQILLARRAAGAQQQGTITLAVNASNQTASLNVQHASDPSASRKLREFVRQKFQPIGVATDTLPSRPPAPSTGGAQTRDPGLVRGREIDHYRIVKRLGAGFSGEVWQAEVVSTPPGVLLEPGQVVAMKQYFPSVLTRTADSLRIQREFRVASEVRHENLVTVHDLVISPSRPFCSFLVMEHVAGDTLRSKIPRRGLDWQQCIVIGKQLAAALTELHAYGALHRDVKPANIMVLPADTLVIKLLDLGIVSLVGERGLTEASAFLGSKHTSAPEQLFGDEIDERSDIYALGATLHHCYRGRPLYDEEGPVTAIVRAMMERPKNCIAKDGASEPERAFVEFINRCVSIDAASRPSTARSCAENLDAFGIP